MGRLANSNLVDTLVRMRLGDKARVGIAGIGVPPRRSVVQGAPPAEVVS
jgi:hypothetical protein